MRDTQVNTLLAVILTLVCGCHAPALGQCVTSLPNVLWIIADDLSPDLGCYGVQEVQAPRIDRLANQGRDFLIDKRAGREVIFAARDRSGDAIERIRCVRGKLYKYIRSDTPDQSYHQWSSYLALHCPAFTVMHEMRQRGELGSEQAWFGLTAKPAEELYDLDEDPFEIKNLAGDNAHRDRLEQMRTKLDHWIRATGDMVESVEGDRAYFSRLSQEKRQWYRSTQKKRGLDPDVIREDYLRWWAD